MIRLSIAFNKNCRFCAKTADFAQSRFFGKNVVYYEYQQGKAMGRLMMRNIKVAVCGELTTACDYLLQMGVVQIDKYLYATEIAEESDYHLILIYAPHAEGLLNTTYCKGHGALPVPIRLLNEPCCHSALLELKILLRQIGARMQREAV